MNLFGFNSLSEFLNTLTGAKYKYLALYDFVLAVTLSMGFEIVRIIEGWVWSPFYSLIIYIAVLLADFLSGIMVGMQKKGEGFMTSKGQRLFIIVPFHLVILGTMFNLGRINNDFGLKQIPPELFDVFARGYFVYVLGLNLISFAKNLSLLGFLKGKAADLLAKYVDPHKNLPMPEEIKEIPAPKNQQTGNE